MPLRTASRRRVLAFQRVRQVHLAVAVGKVLLVQYQCFLYLYLQPLSQRHWQKGDAILVTLALSGRDCIQSKINVLDA